MTNEELEILINEYIDGELDKNKEGFLFTQLSLNHNLRDYFKKCCLLKNEFQKTTEKYPDSLDSNILNSLADIGIKENIISPKNQMQKYFLYMVVIVIGIVSIIFINESSINSRQLEKTVMQLENQEQMIKLLINSIPSAEIKSTREESIIITANKM
ncbi:MAG: hypothetical protein M0P71_11310 [Melioribacteraceae bacterium]|nr:hypothetical protein [Melioribacteraceae bacterium]